MSSLTGDQFIRLGLIVSPILFGLAVLYTRASARRALAAIGASVAYALVSLAWDRIAIPAGLWTSPAFGNGSPPLLIYVPLGLAYGGGAGLVGWRIVRRWKGPGLGVFLAAWVLFGLAHDALVSTFTRLLAFGPGLLPYVADALAWASAMGLGLLVIRALGGEARSDLLSGEVTTG